MKKFVLLGVGALALALASPAHASPNQFGCETISHPDLLNWIGKRTICDGPRRPDGSWDRVRIFWTPAHTTSASSYCGEYSCTFTPAQSYDQSIQGREEYVVFDYNVLPDEPGWLPPGTDNIR